MVKSERFTFTSGDAAWGDASLVPLLPLTLAYRDRSVNSRGLLDTGSAVNVLPYRVGLELGAIWEQQTAPLRLTGNLARYEARALIVSAYVGRFAPVELIFAWTKAENVPLLLGHTNFFMEFDVCFYRSKGEFEVKPKG